MANEPKEPGSKTACEAGGKDILAFSVRSRRGAPVDVKVTVCKTAARLFAELDGLTIADQEIAEGLVTVSLGSLARGLHHLIWGVLVTADDWQVKSEVSVGGVTRFRHRKQRSDGFPIPKWLLAIEVK